MAKVQNMNVPLQLRENWVNILYKYMQRDEPWLESSFQLPKLLDTVLSRIHVKRETMFNRLIMCVFPNFCNLQALLSQGGLF